MKPIFSTLSLIAIFSTSLPAQAAKSDVEAAYQAEQDGRCEEAVTAYQQLVDADEPAAMVNLGRLYMTGRCVAKDPAKAEELFVVAASYADPNAHANLATLYFDGLLGEPDYGRAYMHWSQAARRGMIFYSELARMHYQGLGTPKDPETAESILLQGAERGDPASIQMLAEIYSDENGPLYSPEKAANYQPEPTAD